MGNSRDQVYRGASFAPESDPQKTLQLKSNNKALQAFPFNGIPQWDQQDLPPCPL